MPPTQPRDTKGTRGDGQFAVLQSSKFPFNFGNNYGDFGHQPYTVFVFITQCQNLGVFIRMIKPVGLVSTWPVKKMGRIGLAVKQKRVNNHNSF